MSQLRPEPISALCIGENWCCRWISGGGRCQRALAPNYSSIAHGKQACSAFNDATVTALRATGK